MNGVFVTSDFEYFRKLYNDIEWIKDDDANYDSDGWFEIIVPHGDNENSGEGYGSSIIPLTEEYDGQVSYAPIGTVVQGDNDGPGVILDPSNDNQTFLQYFEKTPMCSSPMATQLAPPSWTLRSSTLRWVRRSISQALDHAATVLPLASGKETSLCGGVIMPTAQVALLGTAAQVST